MKKANHFNTIKEEKTINVKTVYLGKNISTLVGTRILVHSFGAIFIIKNLNINLKSKKN